MSTSKETIADVLQALAPLQVRARAMFGEYGIYCDEKIVALVCDDRVFLKPTPAAESMGAELERCPPYPGARDYLLLGDRLLRDGARLRRLVQDTANELPAPKPKRSRKSKGRGKKA